MRHNKKYHFTSKQVPKRKRLILAIIVGCTLLTIGSLTYLWHRQSSSNKNGTPQTSPAQSDNKPKIDLSPATEEDKKANEDHKDELVKEQSQTPPTNTSTVRPEITYAGQYGSSIEVSAFVPSIVEEGGTCTMTATQGELSVTKQVTGVRNAQSTSCPTFIISREEFTATGTWKVTVKYTSAKYSGTSQAKNLEIK